MRPASAEASTSASSAPAGPASGGKPTGGVRRFTPMPMITGPPKPSARMPQTFFPRTNRSFTHLILGRRPEASSTARHTATAAKMVIRPQSVSGGGAASKLIYSPVPGGETNLRPSRPRPAVWLSAVKRYGGAICPARYHSFRRRLVESVSESACTGIRSHLLPSARRMASSARFTAFASLFCPAFYYTRFWRFCQGARGMLLLLDLTNCRARSYNILRRKIGGSAKQCMDKKVFFRTSIRINKEGPLCFAISAEMN